MAHCLGTFYYPVKIYMYITMYMYIHFQVGFLLKKKPSKNHTGVLLWSSYHTNREAVRTFLSNWFEHLEECVSYNKVHFASL